MSSVALPPHINPAELPPSVPLCADAAGWTSTLAERLLSAIAPADHAAVAAGCGLTADVAAARLRHELIEASRQSHHVRQAIRQVWRQAKADVVAAAQLVHLTVPQHDAQCQALIAQFTAEDMLLELLTDEYDDGWQMAREFAADVADPGLRRTLDALLSAWANEPADTTATKTSRVIVFGGHPRDESRFAGEFAAGPFELRWKTFEHRQGDPVARGAVAEAINSADGAIIITGMTSHNIMELARRYAKQRDIPWRCIEKATVDRLTTALREMFPECCT